MKRIFSRLLFCAFALTSVHTFAWGLTGHRIIAEIAENHLNGKAKRHLKQLFGKERMAYWANWPDFIKSDTTGVWKSSSVWHYVNIDPQPDFKAFKDALTAQAGPTMYTQIKTLSEQIKSDKTSEKDKKIALIFLIHIMGDLAQPMHTGRAGDLGGNKIDVTYFGKKTNLHSVWDSDLIDSQKYSYTEFAKLLDIKSKDEVKKIQGGTLEDWIYETHKLANNIYANTPAGSNLSYGYGYKYDALLEQQLLNGGLRLAKVLNDLF
ncbi:S1/P1 Nuclease [Elizabethkingia meningoseptica]|uniref:S1/P1 Nuclease n=1 Tax=Elizabethkingia meningoseptica TaxID=238 RepID=A0A1T3FKQ0_ELIME|nr:MULTISPECIES: S1/P1 nuclease [Elizabethkingia]AQX13577.1 S1/P1 Nuclease [Elizabethkingia meningoseptica]MBG0515362.1 S1/P1 nuclease [Elizabethkingia meningoseptica]MDE5429666.1 S1/P1 nuclease [Elizabethkingia meningoseptica]MDE5434271.1 S1/P1 nuclease [Elizabethkingia meningoseptica]MDE5448081.1 S1/P1 nuclease [Elizabethkingia meningoseptica]